MQMIEGCPDSLIGLRDRALLALGFAGAFRRSELVALEVSDLLATADGFRCTIRHSKTDQEGQGAVAPIAPDAMRHLLAWTEAAGIEDGPLFRAVPKGGRIGGFGPGEQVTHR